MLWGDAPACFPAASSTDVREKERETERGFTLNELERWPRAVVERDIYHIVMQVAHHSSFNSSTPTRRQFNYDLQLRREEAECHIPATNLLAPPAFPTCKRTKQLAGFIIGFQGPAGTQEGIMRSSDGGDFRA